jgi:hypothetical protein
MLHNKNTNTVDINKILDEARSRKPLLELEEIENLLQNRTSKKRVSGKWKNISLLVLTLIICAGISFYFMNNASEKSTEKSIVNNQGKIENHPVASLQNDGNNVIENSNSGLTSKNSIPGNKQINKKQNVQNKDQVNADFREGKNPQEITKPENSNIQKQLSS